MKSVYKYTVLISFLYCILLPTSLYSMTNIVNETDANDIVKINLSIYNNLGLVKEIREISLPVGNSELRLKDISSQIKPSSVMITSNDHLGWFEILEQTYEYDLISPKKLMDKYVGRKLKLVSEVEETGEEKVLDAQLISNNQGPVYLIDKEIHINHPGRVVLPELPEKLLVKPTLVWKINSMDAGRYPLEVSYLTEGLNWQTHYSLILNAEETRADMSGWVTITNNTGVAYKNTNIQLVAGSVNRVIESQTRRMKGAEIYTGLSKGITEEEIFEYHTYSLPNKITLQDNQAKQIKLFNAERIPIKKELRYYGSDYFYQRKQNTLENPQRVGVYLEFENKKTYHLGLPLPEGIIRTYKKDSSDHIHFLGEDNISHIPEDEKVKIHMGYAFDIIAERKQMDWQKISSDIIEVVWEIILKNRKSESAWVVVLESVPGDWEVIESSYHWKKEDAHTLRYDIPITPKAEEKIRYKVRITL